MPYLRWVIVCCAATAMGLGMAACTNGNVAPSSAPLTPVKSASRTPNTPAALAPFDRTAAKKALLNANEVGDGFRVVPEGEVESALAEQASLTPTGTFAPGKCQEVYEAQRAYATRYLEDLERGAIGLYRLPSADGSPIIVVTQAIAPTSGADNGIDPKLLEKCPRATISFGDMTVEVATKLAVVPDLGQRAFAYEVTTSTSSEGQVYVIAGYSATIAVGDRYLGVTVTNLSGDGESVAAIGVDVVQKAFEKAGNILGG